jgi:hypothetical protein
LWTPECNTIVVHLVTGGPELNDARVIDSCTLKRCNDPSRPQTPSLANTEIWTFTSASGPIADRAAPLLAFGGYVAFGSEDQVVHGGCAAANGIVRTDTIVSIPDTTLATDQSVLRFQVSQYNSEAVVRLKDISIDVYRPYPDMLKFVSEPSGSAGAYVVASPVPSSGPRAPMAIVGTKIFTIGRDSAVHTFDL